MRLKSILEDVESDKRFINRADQVYQELVDHVNHGELQIKYDSFSNFHVFVYASEFSEFHDDHDLKIVWRSSSRHLAPDFHGADFSRKGRNYLITLYDGYVAGANFERVFKDHDVPIDIGSKDYDRSADEVFKDWEFEERVEFEKDIYSQVITLTENAKKVFIHEYVHYLDFVVRENGLDFDKTFHDIDYFERPQELNAFFLSYTKTAIDDILSKDLDGLKHFYKLYKDNFPRFKQRVFYEFPDDYFEKIPDKYRKRMIKRLYPIYEDFMEDLESKIKDKK